MQQLYIDRLLRLADHLEAVPPERFNLGEWESECGTVACAIGHACRIPEFQAAGLALLPGDQWDEPYPAFGDYAGFNAAASFFGIEDLDALHLFDPDEYEDDDATQASAVVARIRAFVAGQEVTP